MHCEISSKTGKMEIEDIELKGFEDEKNFPYYAMNLVKKVQDTYNGTIG